MCDYRIVTVGSKNGVDRKMDKSKSRTDLLAAGKKKVPNSLFNFNFFCYYSGFTIFTISVLK